MVPSGSTPHSMSARPDRVRLASAGMPSVAGQRRSCEIPPAWSSRSRTPRPDREPPEELRVGVEHGAHPVAGRVAPVVARLRISTGGACRINTVTCSDTTEGQNRLAENFGTVRASARREAR